MQSSFLNVKLLIPPVDASAILRPRLLKKLSIQENHKLAVVSAPAGFGKTTLLSQWAATGQMPVAWVSLDAIDNVPQKFCSLLVTALHRLMRRVDLEDSLLIQGGEAYCDDEESLKSLIDGLTGLPGSFALVLDDYHLIHSQTIHDFLAQIIQHFPPNFHLVLASRTVPDFPLASLRAKGKLIELGTEDLRFTHQEIANFFHETHRIRLSEVGVSLLEKQTAGWVGNLELIALWLQGKEPERVRELIGGFGVGHHYVREYFTEEIYGQQPGDLQIFMLKTAILERLEASLCDEVTGQGNGREMLEELNRRSLLTPLDERGRWFCYPNLLSDYLMERLHEDLGMAAIMEMHRRACDWFERLGLFVQAANHAMAAQEHDRAVALLNRIAERLPLRDYFTWQLRLAEMSFEAMAAQPEITLFCAQTLILTGDIEALERTLQVIEHAFKSSDDRYNIGVVYVMRSIVSRLAGNITQAIEYGGSAVECFQQNHPYRLAQMLYMMAVAYGQAGELAAAEQLMPEAVRGLEASGDLYATGTALSYWGRLQLTRGRLRQAEETLQQAARLADVKHLEQALAAQVALGLLYYEWNRLDLARKYLLEAVDEAQQARVGNFPPMGYFYQWDRFDMASQRLRDSRNGRAPGIVGEYWPLAYSYLAAIAWTEGDEAEATTSAGKALHYARLLGNEKHLRQSKAFRARLWLREDKMAPARKWEEEAGPSSEEGELPFDRLYDYLTLARLLIAQGRNGTGEHHLIRAIALLERIRSQAERDGRLKDVVEAQALTAIAHWQQGERDQALQALETALALAEPEGFVRIFIDEGEPMAQLLSWAALNGVSPAYVSHLLGANHASAEVRPTRLEVVQLKPVSPDSLSKREIEVLRLIAEGASTQEIAERLYLSIHTVRTHIKNIHAKLDASSRIQAVEQARVLNLL